MHRLIHRLIRCSPAPRSFLLPLFILLGLSPSCGAPASRPASGEIADQVRASLESGEASFDQTTLDRLLAGGTRDGRVDYGYFQDHRTELDAYLERVAEADLAALDPDQLMALLINAYNALTIRSILDHWPVESIRDIDGVWTRVEHRVGRHELTLDQIEHNLLRPFFKDPRIHFAVNCASVSCAPLPPWAYTGEALNQQLEGRTRSFLSDPANVRVEGGTLLVSKYFDWYGEDFTAEGWEPRADTIPAFIARYTRPEVRQFIEARIETSDGAPPIRFLDYDWSLNSVESPGESPDR
jgi:hypothetical protein